MNYRIFFLFVLINIFLGTVTYLYSQSNLENFNPQYSQLKEYLIKYKEIQKNGGWPIIKAGKKIGLGVSDPCIKKLKQRLLISGELIKIQEIITDSFDIELENAVKQFQNNHELDVTGIADEKTIQELNISVSSRIHQIEINMKRWQEMPPEFEKQYLFVNIAANKLEFVENDLSIISMKIIVGRFYRKTPVFNSDLTYISFNPYWIVPPGIMKKDVLPKIKKDTSFIQKNDMVVFQDNKKINYADINWDKIDSNSSQYKIIQNPGRENPLGVVEFSFPNPYYVYMHDTPFKKLFEEASPAYSSGCIRLSKAVELAKYLLNKDKNWKEDKIDSLINCGKNNKVYLEKPIKVYITYFTAWVNKKGVLQFAPDIYKRDY